MEFFAAAMTMECGNQEKLAAYRQEMRQAACRCIRPTSTIQGAVRGRGRPSGAGVRYALAAIKGVGSAATELLVEERAARGPFRDVYDVLARLGTRVLNKRLLEASPTRALSTRARRTAASVRGADVLLRHGAAARRGERPGQPVRRRPRGAGARPTLPEVEDWPALERLQMEST